jgi:ATP-dependent DNA helicase DinG
MATTATTLDWRPFFPEAAPRPLQSEILNFLTYCYDQADAFFIEAPPGVGKSAIAVTLARWHAARAQQEGNYKNLNECRSFITTTTVNLEDQYMRSYQAGGLKQLHSASHFHCTRRDTHGALLTCEEGRIISNTTKRACPGEDPCPYMLAKNEFIANPYGIVNAAYLLTEANYVGKLGKRGLLIADEGHTLGEAICNFLDFRLTPKHTRPLNLDFPHIVENNHEMSVFLTWLKEKYSPRLDERLREVSHQIEIRREKEGAEKDSILLDYLKEWKKAEAEASRLAYMLKEVNPEKWVLERHSGKRGESISLTPITSKGFARPMLTKIADKLVLLSATLIDYDYHRDELEIDPARLGIFSAPSPFPKEHRPIYAVPRISLDHRALEASCTEAALLMIPILQSHFDQRGIVFTSSYDQAKIVRDKVNYLLGEDRLSTHEGSEGKEQLLLRHGLRKNSVIISPSMHEGVDLKGELSAFQIVLKLPFPSLGSKVVKRRRDAIPAWYAYTTALKLIQASGRSIRNERDEAATYILDSAFDWFYARNRNLFPEYWQEAVIFL